MSSDPHHVQGPSLRLLFGLGILFGLGSAMAAVVTLGPADLPSSTEAVADVRVVDPSGGAVVPSDLAVSMSGARIDPLDVPERPGVRTSRGGSIDAREPGDDHGVGAWPDEVPAAFADAVDGTRSAGSRHVEPEPPEPPAAPAGDVWTRLAHCESTGNPRAISPSGRYRGAFQFDLPTWESVGMSGDPIDHSYEDQLAAAQRLHAARGFQPWPACSRMLGLP